jgi:carbonic anhydrase
VAASVDGVRHGLIDNWIKCIGDVAEAHADELFELEEDNRLLRLCELNVLAQAKNLTKTTVIQDAWDRGQAVDVHSWIYSLSDGHMKGLADPVSG